MMLRHLFSAYRKVHQISLRRMAVVVGVPYITLFRFERGRPIEHGAFVKIWDWMIQVDDGKQQTKHD